MHLVAPIEKRNRSPQDDEGRSPVRIMLVDDSMVVRCVLERIIATHADFEVTASMASAAAAVAFLKTNRVDIVILDIEMPDRSGLEALPDILAYGRKARVLVLSSICEAGGPAAVRALSLGACDTLAKPGRNSFAGRFAETLAARLRQLTNEKVRNSPGPGAMRALRPESARGRFNCIAIGASTGGIPALQAFLSGLDSMVNAPILVTQHLPATFIPFLVRQLGSVNARLIELAKTGTRIEQSTIYVAPGEGHLTVEMSSTGPRIRISNDSHNSRYMPAVDPMFASVAQVFGRNSLGVILSGMGNDGTQGAHTMRAHGATIYVQDAESCVVWGMPGQAARAGLACGIMPPAQIAAHLNTIWNTKS